ncbi:ATP binding protein [Amanita muscaria]
MSDDEALSVDVSILSERNKKALVDALNSVNGSKTLVLDSSIAGPLGLVTEVALMKQHGVDKMFWLEPGPLSPSSSNVIYLCRPTITNAKIIAEHIKRHAKESRKFVYTALLVPRVSTLVSQILEEEGVLGDVSIGSYNLQFIPLAPDVISLENDKALREIWVDGDESVLFNSMQALTALQRHYGLFPRIVGKGDSAGRLARLLERQMSKSTSTSMPETLMNPSITMDCLIILDRRVDMITPLLTQLTYEGLIDEVFNIRNSHVEVPASLLSPPVPQTGSSSAATASSSSPAPVALKKDNKKKYHLTPSTDPLLAELKDLNFSAIGKKLNHIARKLDEIQKTDLQAKTVTQLKDFVGKLGGIQSEHQALRLHTGLSELILSYTQTEHFNKSLEIQQNLLASYEVSAQVSAIEDLIAQEAELQLVIRLLCLASITSGGIKAKTLENLKREILQAYGYEYLPLLLALSDPSLAILLPNPLPTSLTSSATAKYPFTSLRKSLRLLIDDSPEALEEVENDISYVYSGYAPISVRLVQCIAQKGGVLSNPADKEKAAVDGDGSTAGPPTKVQAHPIVGWKGFEEVMTTIPGETVDIVQSGNIPATAKTKSEGTKTTVVFFLGGCTYTEIAALRWVGRQNRGRKFLVATTGIISGAGLVENIANLGKPAGTKGDSIQ